MSIAFFPNGDPELEAYGVRLLNRVSRQLREAFDPPELTFAPVGPDFDYASCPELFGGRRGRGPLTVVWDTNLLIDYFQHGRALWKDEPLPDELGDYGDELEALQLIVAVWVIRELRFHILPRVLVDAKRKLSQKRRGERINALENFAAALRLVGSEHEPASARSRARSLKSNGGLRRVLAQVPSTDRPLVADAVESRCARVPDQGSGSPRLQARPAAVRVADRNPGGPARTASRLWSAPLPAGTQRRVLAATRSGACHSYD